MKPSGYTSVVAVIGDPVRHSLSPTIHNAAFAAKGLDWVMVALPVVAEDSLEDGRRILEAMETFGIQGLAVTTPHKESVARALMAADPAMVDPAARALHSVNTLSRDPLGRILGTSTDGEGFVGSLRAVGVELEGARVAMVGAGAAARSVVDALDRCGVAEIMIINRSEAPAVSAAGLSGRARVAEMADLVGADLVVNATSVGMGTDLSPIPAELLGPHQVVTDLVYHPLETALLRHARAIGARTVDGLGMLIHQAAVQQRLWTGADPDIEQMRAAAEIELAARRR